MRVKVTITGASISEIPSEITEPDFPIMFMGTTGDISIHDLAQKEGKRRWREIHGETPEEVYYTFEKVESEDDRY